MRLPTLPKADWIVSAPTRRSALASCVTVASGYDSTAGYFTSLFSGTLLNRVARPWGNLNQPPGEATDVLCLEKDTGSSRRIQQSTVKELWGIGC
jgi:hypothetical protein